MPFIAADGHHGIFKVIDQRQQTLGGYGSCPGDLNFGFDPGNDADLQVGRGQTYDIVIGFHQNIAQNRQSIAIADGTVDPLESFKEFFSAYSKFHLLASFYKIDPEILFYARYSTALRKIATPSPSLGSSPLSWSAVQVGEL